MRPPTMPPRPSVARLAALSHRSLLRLFVDWCDVAPHRLIADMHFHRSLASLVEDAARPVGVRLAAADLLASIRLAGGPIDGTFVHRRARAFLERLAEGAGNGGLEDLADRFGDAPLPTSSASEGSAILPIVLWLPHVRSPFNVGNIIRSAAAFGVAGVVLGDDAPRLDHPRLRRAAMGALRMVPILRGGYAQARRLLEGGGTHGLAGDSGAQPPLIVLETGGVEASSFAFPPAGVLALGHEELGLDPALCRRARRAGMMVAVAHDGPKASLNVGVAAGICLSWWRASLLGTAPPAG